MNAISQSTVLPPLPKTLSAKLTKIVFGSAELPFAPIVASGPNGALPHATLTDRPIAAGDLITLDWGAAKNGYNADLTRKVARLEPVICVKG